VLCVLQVFGGVLRDVDAKGRGVLRAVITVCLLSAYCVLSVCLLCASVCLLLAWLTWRRRTMTELSPRPPALPWPTCGALRASAAARWAPAGQVGPPANSSAAPASNIAQSDAQ
jgi:hypothetical protein